MAKAARKRNPRANGEKGWVMPQIAGSHRNPRSSRTKTAPGRYMPWATLLRQPFAKSSWFCGSPGEPALVLLYRGFGTPVLFALGKPAGVQGILGELSEVPRIFLHIRPDILPLFEASYRVRDKKAMWRMILDRRNFRPAPAANSVRLGAADLPAAPKALPRRRRRRRSTRVLCPRDADRRRLFSASAPGMSWSRPPARISWPKRKARLPLAISILGRDSRGRGLAGCVTTQVAAELLRRDIRTLALNVHQLNSAAIGVYERLGFTRYCEFVEGLAELTPPHKPSSATPTVPHPPP